MLLPDDAPFCLVVEPVETLPVFGVGGLCLLVGFVLCDGLFLPENLGRIAPFSSKGHDDAMI